MILNILLLILGFVLMEFVAWLTHKYVMHGFLWRWHKWPPYARPRPRAATRLEENRRKQIWKKRLLFYRLRPARHCVDDCGIYFSAISVGVFEHRHHALWRHLFSYSRHRHSWAHKIFGVTTLEKQIPESHYSGARSASSSQKQKRFSQLRIAYFSV